MIEKAVLIINFAETHALLDTAIPLLERLVLGPLEDDAKLFIMERQQAFDITQEVGFFMLLI